MSTNDDANRKAGPLEINLLGLYMVAIASTLAYLLTALWPTASGIDKKEWVPTVTLLGHTYNIAPETRMTLIVMTMGALGSFVHAATSFGTYVGNQRLYLSWFWWYFLRPFIGMGLALLFYYTLFGGMLSAGSAVDSANPFGIAAVAGMVGMFAKQATDKLNETFSTLFKTNPERGDGEREDKLSNQAAVLRSLFPEKIEVGSSACRLSLKGQHFVRGAVVRVNASERETSFASDTELSAELRQEDFTIEGELEISVFSPPPGGGASNILKLFVTPRDKQPDVPIAPSADGRSLEA